MPFVIQLNFIRGLVLGLEYFNEDEKLPFALALNLFFIRIMVFFNATVNDHDDLGDLQP